MNRQLLIGHLFTFMYIYITNCRYVYLNPRKLNYSWNLEFRIQFVKGYNIYHCVYFSGISRYSTLVNILENWSIEEKSQPIGMKDRVFYGWGRSTVVRRQGFTVWHDIHIHWVKANCAAHLSYHCFW